MTAALAVVNPAAGLPDAARACARRLVERGLADRAVATAAPGHATRIVREAAEAEVIIAVGGDGTVLEVLAGLDRERQVLAVMPVGHGNCLARDLGCSSVARAMAALRAPRVRTIDLMGLEVRRPGGGCARFLAASTVAVGYLAQVVDRGRTAWPWLGRVAYAAAAVVTVPRPLALERAVDGREPAWDLRTGLVVNNTGHLGNFRAFRSARLDDGRLDIMETAAGWVRQVAHNAAILAGSGWFGPARLYQAERLDLRLEAPGTLMVDGELLPGVAALSVVCLPGACRCLEVCP